MSSTEIIILVVVAVVGIYIFIESSINSNKIRKAKKAKKTKETKKDEVELKTVVAPTLNDIEKGMNSFEVSMEEVAKESIEDERKEKTAWAQEQAMLRKNEFEEKEKQKQAELEREISRLRSRLDSIDLNDEEQGFIDELENLSPELKATLFADILKRKGY